MNDKQRAAMIRWYHTGLSFNEAYAYVFGVSNDFLGEAGHLWEDVKQSELEQLDWCSGMEED